VNIEFSTSPSPPHKDQNTFFVKLSSPNGAPVTGARVTVTFHMPAMPAMGMGAMNTTISLGDQGNGSYQGTGSLSTGGDWQVTITAEKNGHTIATRQLRVSVTGGM
jgi:Cu(I)/Ag(I) efflux system membrane fusion protein/cobalt-zinc-cadmium efflux system membrane fusion protein